MFPPTSKVRDVSSSTSNRNSAQWAAGNDVAGADQCPRAKPTSSQAAHDPNTTKLIRWHAIEYSRLQRPLGARRRDLPDDRKRTSEHQHGTSHLYPSKPESHFGKCAFRRVVRCEVRNHSQQLRPPQTGAQTFRLFVQRGEFSFETTSIRDLRPRKRYRSSLFRVKLRPKADVSLQRP